MIAFFEVSMLNPVGPGEQGQLAGHAQHRQVGETT
jgi:hypothetical protein